MRQSRFAVLGLGFALFTMCLWAVPERGGAADVQLVAPGGFTADRTPTYRWRVLQDATKYRLMVYRGTTSVLNKVFTTSVCDTDFCEVTPDLTLLFAKHTWKVRPLVGDLWQAPSPAMPFEVVNSGFNSPFTGSKAGWTAVNGVWELEEGGYLASEGVENAWSSVSHAYNYPTFDYQVRMLRAGSPANSNTLLVRGTTKPLAPDAMWDAVYLFQYSNGQSYSIWKCDSGSCTAIVNWTYHPFIASFGWNLLRVRASGSTLEFFINGWRMWSGTDTTFSSGKVGIAMYNHVDYMGPDALLVDYAKLGIDLSQPALEPAADSVPGFVPAEALAGGDVTGSPVP